MKIILIFLFRRENKVIALINEVSNDQIIFTKAHNIK